MVKIAAFIHTYSSETRSIYKNQSLLDPAIGSSFFAEPTYTGVGNEEERPQQ